MSFTTQDVKRMRDETGMSMMQCKAILEREDLHDEIDAITDLEGAKSILHILVSKLGTYS